MKFFQMRDSISSTSATLAKLYFVSPLLLLLFLHGAVKAQVFDEIDMKDGSRIVGEIANMVGDTMTVKTAFGGDIKVAWKEVKSIKTAKPYTFVVGDGKTQLHGLAQGAGEDSLDIRANAIAQASTVTLASITAINPPEKKAVIYKGNISLGTSLSDGNTRNRTLSLLSELEARAERLRLSVKGNYNYAEDETSVTAQNGKASLKLDFFLTKRLYFFASSLFEHDDLQSLELRTALSAGPGYQFIDKGDFAEEWLKEMQLYGEAGLAYFDENYKRAKDKSYVSARWSVKFDWPILPKQLVLFHFHEGYPGLERAEDLYISTEQGVRIAILAGLVATLQVNWRWDNTPASGFHRSDTLYLATLGYGFEF